MPSSARRRPAVPPAASVRIVSANDETRDGLEAYLRQAGIAVQGTRELEGSGTWGATKSPPTAIVFFPDEFPVDDVLRVMRRVHREHPRVRVVVVTHQRQRFADAFETDDDGLAPAVIPKPAWGWTILDAIRGGTIGV